MLKGFPVCISCTLKGRRTGGQRGCSHCRVFAIKYRTTPCNRPIANQAKQVGKLAADPHANQKPAGLNCASQVTGRCSVAGTVPQSYANGRSDAYLYQRRSSMRSALTPSTA